MKKKNKKYDFQVGDLIVAKDPAEDYKKYYAIVVDVFPGGMRNKVYERPSITFRYAGDPEDIERDIEFMERVLTLPNTKERWLYYPANI